MPAGERDVYKRQLEDLDEDLWKAEFLPGGITEESLKDLCALEGAGHEML